MARSQGRGGSQAVRPSVQVVQVAGGWERGSPIVTARHPAPAAGDIWALCVTGSAFFAFVSLSAGPKQQPPLRLEALADYLFRGSGSI